MDNRRNDNYLQFDTENGGGSRRRSRRRGSADGSSDDREVREGRDGRDGKEVRSGRRDDMDARYREYDRGNERPRSKTAGSGSGQGQGNDRKHTNTGRSSGAAIGRWAGIIVLLFVFACGIATGAVGKSLVDSGKGSSGSMFGKNGGKTQETGIEEDEAADSAAARLEGIKQSFSEGNTILQTMKKFFPDDLVIYKNNKCCFMPIDRSLKQNTLDTAGVKRDANGFPDYVVDGDIVSVRGIDVSQHQGKIDWQKVAADKAGIKYAIIRALYRGYETGNLAEDKQFRANFEGARANGLDTGVYIFTQALNRHEVDGEIAALKELLGDIKPELPVVIDVEDVPDKDGRMDMLTKEERTEIIKYYCEQVENAGYKPMIYFNLESAMLLIDISEFEQYEKWFASYNTDFYYPYAYRIWQYSDRGKIDGINGNVDLDLYFTDMSKVSK